MRALIWFLLAVGASVGPAVWSPALEPEGGALVQDFGTVFTGEAVVRTFEIRNPGDTALRITSVSSNCGCVHGVPSTRLIEAGDSATIQVALTTEGRYGKQRFRVLVETDEGRIPLVLHGTVRAVIWPKPPRLFLSELEPGTKRTERVAVEVLEPIEELAVEGERVTAVLDGTTVLVTIEAAARAGPTFGGVKLSYRTRKTGRALTTWIPVVWAVPAPVKIEPREVRLVSGKASLRVTPRWATVESVDVGALPLTVARTGNGFDFVSTGKSWEFPAGASVRLILKPDSAGPMVVPVTWE